MKLMTWDGLLCMLFPRLARWTVVGIGRTGADIPMDAVRFRWQRSTTQWAEWSAAHSRDDEGLPGLRYEARRLR